MCLLLKKQVLHVGLFCLAHNVVRRFNILLLCFILFTSQHLLSKLANWPLDKNLSNLWT